MVSGQDGKNISISANYVHSVILTQSLMLAYYRNTNIQVTYSFNYIALLSFLGVLLIFDDDNLIGTK